MIVSIKICLYSVISILLVPRTIESANVLVILPTRTRSHYNVFESIIRILGTEHNVTFYSIDALNKPHTNITEHRFNTSYSSTDTKLLFRYTAHQDPYTVYIQYLKLCSPQHFNSIFTQNSFQRLINSTDKYDMLITSNCCSEAFFKLSHLLNIPLVQTTFSVSFPWTNAAIGNDNNMANDIYFHKENISNSFLNRVTSFVKQMYLWLYYEWVFLPNIDYNTRIHFPSDTPTLKELIKDTQGVLLNTVSPMGYARANTPNVLEIGGLHCHPPKPLSTELEDFISGSGKHGVIYFSLGGTVSDIILSPATKRIIVNVFRKLPQRVLWKVDDDILDIPDNVMTSKWFPQQDILGHNQIKLFITQGGILSLQEAVYHGVPVLAMPLILDQFLNSNIVKLKGYGRILKVNQITEQLFQANIEELLSNQKYTNKVKQISAAMKDHTDGNANRLKKFINYSMQHKDPTLLRPLMKTESQFQSMQLDIYAFILCVLFISICLIKFIFSSLSKVITYLQKHKLEVKTKIL